MKEGYCLPELAILVLTFENFPDQRQHVAVAGLRRRDGGFDYLGNVLADRDQFPGITGFLVGMEFFGELSAHSLLTFLALVGLPRFLFRCGAREVRRKRCVVIEVGRDHYFRRQAVSVFG